MELFYNWKTRLFSRTFEIYQQELLKGELVKELWKRAVTGELNSRRIMFKTKGIFRVETEIIDMQGEFLLGNIRFSNLRGKITINYQDKSFEWKYDNFLRSKWSISNENGTLVKYHSRSLKGLIVSYTRDEVLILSGFFVRNFLKQRSAAVAAAS